MAGFQIQVDPTQQPIDSWNNKRFVQLPADDCPEQKPDYHKKKFNQKRFEHGSAFPNVKYDFW